MRLSNGGMDRAPMPCPIFAGLRPRFGVHGESALGNGPAKSQDFTLINQEKFAFAQSDEFVDFVVAAANGNGALLKFPDQALWSVWRTCAHCANAQDRQQALRRFRDGSAVQQRADGLRPYAVRVRLVPADSNGMATPGANKDWGSDFSVRLRQQALHWDMQLQPYVSEN